MSVETIYKESVEFSASESLESRRIPDFYSYLIKNGKIYSPVTNRPVEESITARTPTEFIEKYAFEKIQNWAVFSIGGSCVWISPPVRNNLSAKAVISEIQNDSVDGKILTNRNICFDWKPEIFLSFALYAGRLDIASGEDFRGKPIFLSPDEHFKLYELLEQIEPIQIKQVRTGEDIKIKENLKAQIASGQKAPMGTFALSCPTPFEVFSGETFPCPKCHGPIRKGLGITTCPNCGARKEDFKSSCD